MTPQQTQIVKLTFAKLMDQKMEAGRIFYERLFAIAPETRALFKSDIPAQSRKLMDTLALAIGSLRDTPALVGMLEGLAQRHVGYGVRHEHYDHVGRALMETLEKVLGSGFTSEAREAWSTLYATVAAVMRKAAERAPAA